MKYAGARVEKKKYLEEILVPVFVIDVNEIRQIELLNVELRLFSQELSKKPKMLANDNFQNFALSRNLMSLFV